MSAAPVLVTTALSASYGKVSALRDVSISIDAGEIVTILGANGAGKSTLLNVITGVVPASAGSVAFRGEDVTKVTPWKAVELGIVQVPEGRQVFPGMTVEANLSVAARPRLDDNGFDKERVYEMFPRLVERRRLAAGNLSGGEQQMLAIGRALVAQPRVLLLDEPSLGLAPKLAQMVLRTVAELRKAGIAVLLVEQNAAMALEIADRGYVLANGQIATAADARTLEGSDEVRRAYLGA